MTSLRLTSLAMGICGMFHGPRNWHHTRPKMARIENNHEVQPYGETLEEVKALRRTWTFMSSREEREKERSRLDSMVLLIMKLDQLDKEIENALSSSLSGTPILKRRIISDPLELLGLDQKMSCWNMIITAFTACQLPPAKHTENILMIVPSYACTCLDVYGCERNKLSKFLIECRARFNLDQLVNIADCSDRGQGDET
ncbi:hypothetical protein F2P79_011843 [Pimephales promelas]|nr:hypothetical protein F2P79_011843 [Pimephales promelas]